MLNNLKNISLFEGFSEDELREFIDLEQIKEYQRGDTIFSEGAPGDALFIILSGKVKICRKISEDNIETLTILGKNEYFGEMALIDGKPRSASAIAEKKSRLLLIKKTDFEKMLMSKSQVALKLLKTLVSILSTRLRETNNKFSELTKNGLLAKQAIEKMKIDIISLVSHELRTPLTVIKTSSNLLKRGMVDQEKKSTFLSMIDSQANHLTRIIDDIIYISKEQTSHTTLQKYEFDIVKLLRSVLTSFKSLADEKKVALDLANTETSLLVYADQDKLKLAFSHLIDNALKFTPAEGKINISVKQMSAEKRNNFTEISIEDTGVGITKENIDSIFNKFQQIESTLTRTQGGMGLGLSIVKNIIDAHGGKISVDSKVEKGTKFTLIIPSFSA